MGATDDGPMAAMLVSGRAAASSGAGKCVRPCGGTSAQIIPSLGAHAMGMQSLIGYSLGMISPTLFGWALDLTHNWRPLGSFSVDWGIAFATAGLGGVAGPVFMYLLRRLPESEKMAGGRK